MLKYIRYVIAGLLVACAIWLTYRTGFQHGSAEASNSYYIAIAARQTEIGKNLEALETNVNALAAVQSSSAKRLQGDMTKILANIKREPVVIIENGKCVPSPTFLQGLDDAINRANSK